MRFLLTLFSSALLFANAAPVPIVKNTVQTSYSPSLGINKYVAETEPERATSNTTTLETTTSSTNSATPHATTTAEPSDEECTLPENGEVKSGKDKKDKKD